MSEINEMRKYYVGMCLFLLFRFSFIASVPVCARRRARLYCNPIKKALVWACLIVTLPSPTPPYLAYRKTRACLLGSNTSTIFFLRCWA